MTGELGARVGSLFSPMEKIVINWNIIEILETNRQTGVKRGNDTTSVISRVISSEVG